MKRQYAAVNLAFLLSACGQEPDSLYIINHNTTPVYVSVCSDKPDKEGRLCWGWEKVARDESFKKEAYGGQKLYVMVSRGGTPINNFSGDFERKDFVTSHGDFEINKTGYPDMEQLRWSPHKINTFGWRQTMNHTIGDRAYPYGWEEKQYIRAPDGQTSLRLTP